ncbi:MAG: heavy metal response regulator transcription factor [Methylococcaceae bacterium]|nr:heavy metal response regulator transcription factor [Methylococcaceae bacterium]
MHILIIEDQQKTASFIAKALTEEGFGVDIATNGIDGQHNIEHIHYDLIILDVMLPEKDGWSILEDLRLAKKQTPVLLLTAKDSVEDKVKGLKLGADDYMVKPFAFSELLARIRSILRRGPVREINIISIIDLEIDAIKHQVKRNGIRIDLTPKEFQLLLLMARRQGEVLSRTFIAEQVWEINFNSDTNVVDVAVRRLRRKVDDGFSHSLIHTVRGIGYVFEKR